MKRVILSLTLAATVALGGVAFATNQDHGYKKPTITKTVENVTTGQGPVDANDADHALVVNTGDVLVYHVVASGKTYGLKIEDNLPDGVEKLAQESSDHGRKLDISVKVTAEEGSITNTACLVRKSHNTQTPSVSVEEDLQFSILKKKDWKPRHKEDICDSAVVTLFVPTPTPTPTATPMPEPTPVSNQVLTLPEVGGSGRLSPR